MRGRLAGSNVENDVVAVCSGPMDRRVVGEGLGYWCEAVLDGKWPGRVRARRDRNLRVALPAVEATVQGHVGEEHVVLATGFVLDHRAPPAAAIGAPQASSIVSSGWQQCQLFAAVVATLLPLLLLLLQRSSGLLPPASAADRFL